MKFMSQINFVFIPQDKLQKAVQDFIKTVDRLIINEEDLPEFQNLILNKINQLNSEFKRCRSINADFDSNYREDPLLSGVDCIYFVLRHCDDWSKVNG